MAIEDDEIRNIISGRMARAGRALGGTGGEFAIAKAKALRYYWGDDNSSDELTNGADRSSAVSRDLAETIDGAMPSLVRTFASGDEIVRCAPRSDGDDVQKAEQSTQYINYVLAKNNGYLFCHDWLKDGLLSRVGFAKAYWQKEDTQTIERYQDLTQDEADEMGAQDIGDNLFEVARQSDGGFVKLEVIPPEEIWIESNARSIDTAPIIAHGRLRSISDIREDGFGVSDDDVTSLNSFATIEEVERDRGTPRIGHILDGDPSMHEVMFFEAYTRIDILETGIAQLYKVFFIGENCSKILHFEPCDKIQIVAWTPNRMPHRFMGKSMADDIVDIQDDKTFATRAIMDNLSLAVNPRRKVIPDRVNMEQVLNNAVGQVISVEDMNAIEIEQTPQVLAEALQVIQYLDGTKAQRTGLKPFVSTLDGVENAYTSTLGGVERINESSNDRLELIAKNFAEIGFKPLVKLILSLGSKHEQGKVTHNKQDLFSENFDPDLEIDINLGLGTKDKKSQFQRAAALFQGASQILQLQGGLNNPEGFLRPNGAFEVLKEWLIALGYKNYETFIEKPQEQDPNAPPSPNQPSMDEVKAQHDMATAQAQMQNEMKKHEDEMAFKDQQLQAEIELKRYEIDQRIALERDKMSIGLDSSSNIHSDIRFGGEIG